MKKLLSLLLMLPLLAPQLSFAAGKADLVDHFKVSLPVSFTYQKVTWTFRSDSAEDLASQFCEKLDNAAHQYIFQRNESDLYFIVKLKATGNETAMEELSLAHEGLTYEGCQKKLKSELIAAQVAFAPLKPAEFIRQPEPTKLDGTSMATPAIKGEVSKKTGISMPTLQARGRAELDHVGAYNFMVEISGVEAGYPKSTQQVWSFRPEIEDEVVVQFCQKLADWTLSFQEVSGLASEFILKVTMSAKGGGEVAMEELSLAHEGLTYEGCMKAVEPVFSKLIGTAPTKPAELDGTSMATPAVKSSRQGGAYGDHIGAYNFRVEIDGVDAGQFAGVDE